MKRLEIVKQMLECGLVAVIRAESKEQGVKIIDVVIKGGIKQSEKQLLNLLQKLRMQEGYNINSVLY